MQQQFALKISKEQLATLPLATHPAEIVVVETAEQARQAVDEIRRHTVTGFDTETRPSFHKGRTHSVALIQIATPERTYLFRINLFGLLPEITSLFEDEKIVKVGLSTKDDFHMLFKLQAFTPANCVELQNMVKEYQITDCSLQKIYGILFDERISKGQRLSNWEAPTLTESQCKYAAIDARACLRIYDTLTSGAFDQSSSPYLCQATD